MPSTLAVKCPVRQEREQVWDPDENSSRVALRVPMVNSENDASAFESRRAPPPQPSSSAAPRSSPCPAWSPVTSYRCRRRRHDTAPNRSDAERITRRRAGAGPDAMRRSPTIDRRRREQRAGKMCAGTRPAATLLVSTAQMSVSSARPDLAL